MSVYINVCETVQILLKGAEGIWPKKLAKKFYNLLFFEAIAIYTA